MNGNPMVADALTVDADALTFRVRDVGGSLTGVRLLPDLSLPAVPASVLEFTPCGDGWLLRLPRPPVQRMEYRLELRHLDGKVEEVCDPGNPIRTPGAFGDKSVVELPGYHPPDWLTAGRIDLARSDLAVASRWLGARVAVQLCAPADSEPDEPLPLLIAHDGPEYDRLAALTTFTAAMVQAKRLPRHRVALVAPGDRNEWYSANISYARAFALAVVPALRREVAVAGPVVGLGASLGGLAMLHIQRRHPGVLGGLFMQSGSFFDRRLDPQERSFSRYVRVTRFVADAIRGVLPPDPVPAVVTCGVAEENRANNRKLAAALLTQGYDVTLLEVPDAHNFVAWRDAWDPALTGLLSKVWAAEWAAS